MVAFYLSSSVNMFFNASMQVSFILNVFSFFLFFVYECFTHTCMAGTQEGQKKD